MRRKFLIAAGLAVLVLASAAAAGWALLNRALGPADHTATQVYFRVEEGDTVASVLDRAERRGLLRSARAVRLHARLARFEGAVRPGTFRLSASMRGDVLLRELIEGEPVRRMVTIREGLWKERVADLFKENGIGGRDEALERFADPAAFKETAGLPLPDESLEGYLFPDTYDLPPLIGVEEAIQKMLSAFREKVYEPLGKPDAETLRRWVVIASMIELEAAKDEERPRIAGVIYNRLERGMPLQIDATVAYAKGEWGPVSVKDYEIDHPYNTYRIAGLPPGPICSPGFASIKAAAEPDEHDYFYYVAMPGGTHSFSGTYREHLRNIRLSRAAFAQQRTATADAP
ncbi:MAG: endolytic transglycosylase MltG [Armatimonadetes bacterium]|nr:endolytic transglycosylase MltG [Armatimonadota bacterium]